MVRAQIRALKITVIYAFFGMLWITSTDHLLGRLINDIGVISRLSMYKGWLFMLVTSTLIYFLTKIAFTRQDSQSKLLSENEDRYRQLFDGGNDAVFVHTFSVDEGPGRFVEVNSVARQRLGYTREEFMTKTPYDINAKLSIQKGRDAIAQILLHKTLIFETIHVTKTGKLVPVEVSSRLIQVGDQQLIMSISRDISERILAEQERETIIAFLHFINNSKGTSELIQAAIQFFQRQTGCEAVGIRLKEGDDYPYYETCGFAHDFVLMENSLCTKDMNGQIMRDDCGDPLLECMCGNIICGRFDPSKPFFTKNGSFWSNCTTDLLASTTDADRQAHTRNKCNGEGYESVALVPLISGTERLGLLQFNDRRKNRFTPEKIDLWERLAGYLAVALAKFQADDILRHSEERYRYLFQNMLNGFALCRMHFENGRPVDFTYVQVNTAFEVQTGLKDVVGRKVSEVIPGIRESDPELFEIYGLVTLTGKPESFEVFVDALQMWFYITVYRPFKEHFVAVFDVITERKRAEDKLRKSLNEKEVLLKKVHHRVKNNLQIVESLLSLQARQSHSREVTYMLHDTRDRVKSMALLHQMLYHSENLALINFAAYVKELAVQILRSFRPASGRVRVESHVAPVELSLDQAVPAGLIINELVSNALKHAFPGDRTGSVTVDLKPGEGRNLVLTVSDDGTGLPAGFDPVGPLSLGLKLVWNLAGQLGGTVEVRKPSGGGAVFRVVFPLPDETEMRGVM